MTVSGAPEAAPIEPPLCHPPPPATVGHPTALYDIASTSLGIASRLAAFAHFSCRLDTVNSVYKSQHFFLEEQRTSSSPFPFIVTLAGALVSFLGCRVIRRLPFPGIAPSTPLSCPCSDGVADRSSERQRPAIVASLGFELFISIFAALLPDYRSFQSTLIAVMTAFFMTRTAVQ